MTTDTKPTVGTIKRANGVAGQVAYSVMVTYPGEDPMPITFVGSTYGGPVLMMTRGNPEGTFVSEPSRFGKFNPEWVRRFFTSNG